MRSILVLVFILFIFSCTTKLTESDLVEIFQKKCVSLPEGVKICVIIPESGCGGCIAAGMSFIQENASSFSNEQHNNVVVFTKIHSMKLLKRQLGGVRLESLNSIVDTMRTYSINTKDGVYPIVLYLDGNKIKSVNIASPKTDTFEQLQKEL